MPVSGFNFSWTPAATGGIPDYYAVYMSNDENSLFDQAYWETTSTVFNPVSDGGVTFGYGERWYWTVEAINASGSALSEATFRFDTENQSIGIEAPLVAISASGVISWQAVQSAVNYRIYRCSTPDGEYLFVEETSNLSWHDTALPADKSFYRVTAVTSSRNSP